MPKAVMLSIRPRYCEMIAGNFKSIEVRKTRPKIETPFKCYIYETQGKTDTPWMDEDGHMVFRGHGAVIGEFVCDSIFPLSFYASDASFFDTEPPLPVPGTCLTDKEIAEYLGNGKTGYGWHISNLVIYDEPKRIFDFVRPACERVFDCGAGCSYWCGSLRRCMRNYTVLFPPQSWMYVEELK